MIDAPTSLLYLGEYAVATLAGHVAVRWVLRLCPLPSGEGYQGLRRAGTVIGILERIFTVTLVILGQYAAIAILFAAKSIVRFGEARERHFAEYYLIGTLASILFALLTGQAAIKLAALLRL